MSPAMRTASPGPGNGCRQTRCLRQTKRLADQPHLVLEQQLAAARRARSPSSSGRRADIVVGLDHRGLAGRTVSRLDDVRDRWCPGPGTARPRKSSLASSLNTSMNSCPMRRRFSCGSVTPASFRSETGAWASIDVQIHAEMVPGTLTRTNSASRRRQQAVVHEDVDHETVADGTVNQRRGHAAVDAAGKPADHAVHVTRPVREPGVHGVLDDVLDAPGRRGSRKCS